MSKQKPYRLGYLIHDVSRLRRTAVDAAFKPLGVTRSQWWVLANLARHDGKGMMQTELAELMGVGKVTLGGLIDRLEIAELVERQPDPNDRRAKRIYMTAKGKKLLGKLAKIAEKVNEEVTQDLTAEDVDLIEEGLSHIKKRLLQKLNHAGNQQ